MGLRRGRLGPSKHHCRDGSPVLLGSFGPLMAPALTPDRIRRLLLCAVACAASRPAASETTSLHLVCMGSTPFDGLAARQVGTVETPLQRGLARTLGKLRTADGARPHTGQDS